MNSNTLYKNFIEKRIDASLELYIFAAQVMDIVLINADIDHTVHELLHDLLHGLVVPPQS